MYGHRIGVGRPCYTHGYPIGSNQNRCLECGVLDVDAGRVRLVASYYVFRLAHWIRFAIYQFVSVEIIYDIMTYL